jgi:hypothetical protein
VQVAHFEDADKSGFVSVDITAQAAGEQDVQVRFHYHNARNEWWWAIDVHRVGGGRRVSVRPTVVRISSARAARMPAATSRHLGGTGDPTPGGSLDFAVRSGAPGAAGSLLVSTGFDLAAPASRSRPPIVAIVRSPSTHRRRVARHRRAERRAHERHVFVQWLGAEISGTLRPPRTGWTCKSGEAGERAEIGLSFRLIACASLERTLLSRSSPGQWPCSGPGGVAIIRGGRESSERESHAYPRTIELG